ncbi:MAG: ABC transporter ATP-binding protein [Alphaproteobacteria bacterium]|nr:ABC transporter ATP-binding protein [Alphaproteobacteria bacterium]
MKRLIKDYIRPYTGKLYLAIFCMIVCAAMTAANAWMLQPVLDEIFLNKNVDMLELIIVAVVAIAAVNSVATYGQNVLLRYVGQRVISDMQIQLFDHLLKSDIGVLHAHSTGGLISRFTNDIILMRMAVSNVLIALAKESITLVFLIGLMIYQNWQMSIIALFVLPVCLFPILRLGRRMRKISWGTQEQLGSFTSQLDETFAGVRMVKAYNREGYEVKRATGTIDKLFNLYYKASRVQAASSPITELLAGFAIGAVIYYGGTQVIVGKTTPGAFMSFLAALLMVYRPMKALANINNNLQEALAAADRFFAVLDVPPSIQDKPGAGILQVGKGEIRFEDVSFCYTGTDAGVKGIDITIPAGKTIALVGPSGGGKSTIINLILRFYQATEGRILIDGTDTETVTLASLRSHIGLVSQETVLFDDTISANIAYGREGATQDEIIEAAKSAAAHEFILQMPHGYDTVIGSHGLKLSGGQRQRIAIARAMLKDAPILLLDEATSALDTTSERHVQDALNTLMKNRTTLVIAHRLSTVQQADYIYVMGNGQIIESGTHAELIARNGAYTKLYKNQFETSAPPLAVT